MAKRSGTAEAPVAGEDTTGNDLGTDATEPVEGGSEVTKPARDYSAPKRPRSSEYLMEEWSSADVPKRKGGGNRGPRDSVLDKQVLQVIDKFPTGTGKGADGEDRMILIARYGNGGAGGVSAATTLRKRWVDRNKGVTFLSRQLDEDTRGVFVKYVPVKDDEGATE